VIGRLVRSVDFERVLNAPSRARSAHFAVHHLAGRPSAPSRGAVHALSTELSTEATRASASPVDEAAERGDPRHDTGCWIGAVVPKRHARRAVTRSLLKRQMRAAFERQRGLPGGLWVLRLRAPFDRTRFPSAASHALRRAAHDELDALLADAARRSRLAA
jgi:ribonuclease P protein component